MKKISTILCVALTCLLLSACGNSTTATVSIQNAHMTTSTDSNQKPSDTITNYGTSAKELIVTADLKNAAKDTTIKYVWTYVTNSYEIKVNTVKYAEAGDKSLKDSLALENYDMSVWPEGDYKVEIFINDQKTATAIAAFVIKDSVVAPSASTTAATSTTKATPIVSNPLRQTGASIAYTTANLQNTHMTTKLSDAGAPLDTVTSYKTTATQLIASAELHNAPDNTLVTFVLRYVTSDILIGSYQLDSGDITDRYVFCYFVQDKAWPVGEYAVDIYIDNQEAPAKTISFTVNN